MSCANETCSSVFAVATRQPRELGRPTFITAIITIIDVIEEALEMRRAAHKRYRLDRE
jgi:hypothetical protein